MTDAELENFEAINAVARGERPDASEMRAWVVGHVAPALIAEVKRLLAQVSTVTLHLQVAPHDATTVAAVIEGALRRGTATPAGHV